MSNNTNLYLPPEYKAKAAELLKRLSGQGVKLTDQKGQLSLSALIRYLIDQEISKEGK